MPLSTLAPNTHLLYVILEFECVVHQLEVPVHGVGAAVRVGAAPNWRKVTHKWQVALHRQGNQQLHTSGRGCAAGFEEEQVVKEWLHKSRGKSMSTRQDALQKNVCGRLGGSASTAAADVT
jgi:hypothetical protein